MPVHVTNVNLFIVSFVISQTMLFEEVVYPYGTGHFQDDFVYIVSYA